MNPASPPTGHPDPELVEGKGSAFPNPQSFSSRPDAEPGSPASALAGWGGAGRSGETPVFPPARHRAIPRTNPLTAYCTILILALFFITFIAQPFGIPSESMTPTLQVGDFLLGSKQAFAPAGPLDKLLPPTTIHRGDIVIFRFPPDPSRELVKRVIGLPGDRIHLHAGRVILNGLPLNEPYAAYNFSFPDNFRDEFPALRRTDPNVDPAWWAELHRTAVATPGTNPTVSEIIVPPGKYFVLGDNRNNSEDSRYWGYVPRASILARPLFVYFSAAPITSPAPPSSPRPLATLRTELHHIRIIR